MIEELLKLKQNLISKYIGSEHIQELEKYSKILNRAIIDYDYKLDYYDYFLLGAKYLFLKDYTTALIYAEMLLEMKPDFSRAYNLKAAILWRLKRYNQALEFIEKAIELEPNSSRFWSNKSAILSEMGFYKEAIECADKALELEPNYVGALNNKGLITMKLGKYKEALEILEKALSIVPDFEDALLNKAECLIALNRIDEAISILNKLLNKNPKHFLIYYYYAWIYSIKNDKENAIKSLSKAIELEPEAKYMAMDDKYFNNIKDSEEFKRLVSQN